MAKTIDEVALLLTGNGYHCHRDGNGVTTEVPTRAYRNVKGSASLKVHLAFNEAGTFLTLSTPQAFDVAQAAHRESVLACLMAASAETPLVKTLFHPAESEVRIAVELAAGANGVPATNVIRSMALLPTFADRCYPHVKQAATTGQFDLSKALPSPGVRFTEIVERNGGINRVHALLAAQKKSNGRPD
jgi:hypothetical protein